jgi:S-adenosylmethionine-diacylgycerolhomoserine-N-methlytransferase
VTAEFAEHRAFLNKYYGLSRPIYDLTRKYYLFGRDRALQQLAGEPWQRLVEIGPGTGRNLRKLHALRPDAILGGVEASDAMLEHARPRTPFATFVQGFAEQTDYRDLLGARPDRVLFSYALSMFQQPTAAIEHARSMLAPGGELVVVDFADLEGLPSPAARALRKWLRAFHVEPIAESLLAPFDPRLEYGPARYYVVARIAAGE